VAAGAVQKAVTGQRAADLIDRRIDPSAE